MKRRATPSSSTRARRTSPTPPAPTPRATARSATHAPTPAIHFHGESVVNATSTAVIRTSALLVDVATSHSSYRVASTRTAGSSSITTTIRSRRTTRQRNTHWNATVYLLGSANPVLVIDETGRIIEKTSNVHVFSSISPTTELVVGDTINAGETILVGPMLYTGTPTVLFKANSWPGNQSQIDGSSGKFIMQMTWESVKILNESDRPMTMQGTGGPSLVDQHAPLELQREPAADHPHLGQRGRRRRAPELQLHRPAQLLAHRRRRAQQPRPAARPEPEPDLPGRDQQHHRVDHAPERSRRHRHRNDVAVHEQRAAPAGQPRLRRLLDEPPERDPRPDQDRLDRAADRPRRRRRGRHVPQPHGLPPRRRHRHHHAEHLDRPAARRQRRQHRRLRHALRHRRHHHRQLRGRPVRAEHRAVDPDEQRLPEPGRGGVRDRHGKPLPQLRGVTRRPERPRRLRQQHRDDREQRLLLHERLRGPQHRHQAHVDDADPDADTEHDRQAHVHAGRPAAAGDHDRCHEPADQRVHPRHVADARPRGRHDRVAWLERGTRRDPRVDHAERRLRQGLHLHRRDRRPRHLPRHLGDPPRGQHDYVGCLARHHPARGLDGDGRSRPSTSPPRATSTSRTPR